MGHANGDTALRLKMTSWAEQVELDDEGLPPPGEEFNEKKGLKTVTEYKHNDDGKLVKVIRTFRIEKVHLSKSIAKRKMWKKFGAAATYFLAARVLTQVRKYFVCAAI